MIVVPVDPTSIPNSFSRPRHERAPVRGTERGQQAERRHDQPVRNGRTSTSALRATISAPTTTKATGRRRRARRCGREPVGDRAADHPPLQPR
jgi:hypothetical protein